MALGLPLGLPRSLFIPLGQGEKEGGAQIIEKKIHSYVLMLEICDKHLPHPLRPPKKRWLGGSTEEWKNGKDR